MEESILKINYRFIDESKPVWELERLNPLYIPKNGDTIVAHGMRYFVVETIFHITDSRLLVLCQFK